MIAPPEAADVETLDLTAEEIEAAYARALETMDAVEQAVPELAYADNDGNHGDGNSKDQPDSGQPASVEWQNSPAPSEGRDDRTAAATAISALTSDAEQIIQPHQVVEAALFVGGGKLTAKRLAKLLGDESSGDAAIQMIGRLNEQYAAEARPYEITLEEGGYSLTLRSEFERVRDRVYGRNPRDVKLSQEALEVLAFVAYKQPVRCQEVEDAGKSNAANVLRQLVRRQLVSLQREDGATGDVTYITSSRFLDVFGLRNLDELPLPDDLAVK